MIRFNYASPSGARYVVTVIAMDNGSIDTYAALAADPNKHMRKIPLAVEPSQFEAVRGAVRGGARALEALRLEAERTFMRDGAVDQIGAVLAEQLIWTDPGKRTEWPQPLSFFLQ